MGIPIKYYLEKANSASPRQKKQKQNKQEQHSKESAVPSKNSKNMGVNLSFKTYLVIGNLHKTKSEFGVGKMNTFK